MTVYNLGSINIDNVYRVPHLPGPGETLASSDVTKGLGGKGANMSVAVQRAGSPCVHIGSVGEDGDWALDRLRASGVDTDHVHISQPTGHAIINVDDAGENAIVLYPGANRHVSMGSVQAALAEAKPGELFVTQNETNGQVEAAQLAKSKGLKVIYAAAPFSAEAVEAILPVTDMLVLNEVEAQQLTEALGKSLTELGLKDVIVTLGAKGCRWISGTESREFPAQKVTPVDTTGAGDTFTGYLIAGLDQGMSVDAAIELAGKAGAVMVTRLGAADVIPTKAEVDTAFPA
ncbi:Ribokinase [Pelagimonas phthalicica]|uniref:Ribokinase n=1 Tax=Pelagimonas phthalicica TaxID=1037362 RepID=A0A238J7P5_9RHOB|nr:ribokinase [Pelagimonas phthalicica]TDS95299.1 ribokinase [Pelagimonas phthalicica]SMX26177.1 Ribokinase [Pelagimonas phthalicica]